MGTTKKIMPRNTIKIAKRKIKMEFQKYSNNPKEAGK